MGRRIRCDARGAWHHVMNRGIARRAIFEDATDIRYLMSRIAREVRSEALEVHAWCFMATHFHLLVRSPEARLSEAMGRALNAHSRHFNRRHRRDGPLFRARFASKPVQSEAYRRVLVRYIDQNPVSARICSVPWGYRWGSAAHFVHRRRAPWHERAWVRSVVEEVREDGESEGAAYARRFGPRIGAGTERWVEATLRTREPLDVDFDQLIGAAPERIRRWMQRKADLADGTVVGAPVADLAEVDAIATALCPEFEVGGGRGRSMDRVVLFRISMCRALANASWTEISARVGRSDAACARAFARHHQRLLSGSETYANSAAQVAARAVSSLVG